MDNISIKQNRLRRYDLLFMRRFYLTILGLSYLEPSLITSILGVIIRGTKNKRHARNLHFYLNNLKGLMYKQSLPLIGLKFKVAGRLGGRMRKS